MLQFLGSRRASKLHDWFKSYGGFAKYVNFAYWWTFIGSAPAACAAGLFILYTSSLWCSSVTRDFELKTQDLSMPFPLVVS